MSSIITLLPFEAEKVIVGLVLVTDMYAVHSYQVPVGKLPNDLGDTMQLFPVIDNPAPLLVPWALKVIRAYLGISDKIGVVNKPS